MITILLLLWLLPIAGNVYLDRNGRKPNYLIMFLLRGMAAILHGILFDPHNWGDYFPVFVFQVTSFWLFFEIGLNLVRGKGLLYYDTSEGDSGWLDRFFAFTGKGFHFFCKVLAFVIMVISIYFVYTQ